MILLNPQETALAYWSWSLTRYRHVMSSSRALKSVVGQYPYAGIVCKLEEFGAGSGIVLVTGPLFKSTKPVASSHRVALHDEAHFWLNGYVNKQNCRIWSEANPQVYVETPLHLEKLTVWCALWAGGILLQKR
ncbi:hypothetical protein TNCV_1480031 [Trichonephila clavipes]|nr:hypothetical protein TNCV_1480031 [Trichonephila clavipes]